MLYYLSDLLFSYKYSSYLSEAVHVLPNLSPVVDSGPDTGRAHAPRPRFFWDVHSLLVSGGLHEN